MYRLQPVLRVATSDSHAPPDAVAAEAVMPPTGKSPAAAKSMSPDGAGLPAFQSNLKVEGDGYNRAGARV